jgi:hypothetical protein
MVIIREVMKRREAVGGICCIGVRYIGDSRELLPRVGRINQWYGILHPGALKIFFSRLNFLTH